MSDIIPEDQPQNPTNTPSNTDQNIGSVPPSIAGRLASLPRLGSASNYESKMLTALDQIRYLNDRIRINTETTAKFLSEHMKDIDRSQGLVTEVRQQQRLVGADPARLAAKTDLFVPEMKEAFNQKLDKLLGATPTGRIDELRKLNLVDTQGNLRVGGQRINPTDIGSHFASLQKEWSGDLASQIENALVRQVVREAPEDQRLVGRRLENIAEGRTIGKSILGGFKRLIPVGHGMHSPFGIGMGGTTGSTVPSEQFSIFADEEGQASAEAGASRGSRFAETIGANLAAGGLKGRLAGLGARFGAGEGLGAAIPGLGEVLIGYELLKNFGKDIPLVGSGIAMARENFGREALLSGQLTGEGRLAGFGAQQAATALTPGGRIAPTIGGFNLANAPLLGGVFRTIGGLTHPFDPITNQIAEEIVTSVRTQGFTGPRAQELYKGVANVYRDLGLSIDQTTKMITEATRNGGESLGQIVTEMKTFDTAAKNLGININEYAQSISTTAEMFRAGGSGAAATQQAQRFVAGAPRILQTGAGLQAYTQSFQNAAPFLSARLGIPQQYLQLEENRGRVLSAFEQAQNEEFQRMIGTNMEEKAANASRNGIIFKGMGVDQILAIMRKNASGRGPVGIQRLESTWQQYGQDVVGLRGRVDKRIDDLNNAQLAAHGIRRQVLLRGGTQFVQNGEVVSGNKMVNVREDMSAVNPERLAAIRQAAVSRVSDLLTTAQRTELEKHLRDPGYGFRAKLQEFEGGQGRKKNSLMTPFGEIKISFTGKASKALRADVAQRSYQQGYTQPNQSFIYPEMRIDPLGGP